MLGILMVSIGTLFDEISSSFGKWNVLHKRESLYTFGFLNIFWGLIFFTILAIYRNTFVFSFDIIFLFIIWTILEVAQTYSFLKATVISERSTYNFILVGTIPLLLLVDFILGYDISLFNIIGVALIIFGLFFLFINHGLDKKGIGYVIFSTLNAVITVSMYKYMITNYNSVEAQNIVVFAVILVFLFVMAKWKSKENALAFVFKKEFFWPSIVRGVGGVLIGYAYFFAPASFIAGARRGLSVLWGIVSGSSVFHEKHIILKIFAFVFVIAGLVLLVL